MLQAQKLSGADAITETGRSIASSGQSVGLIHDLGNLIQIASSAVNIIDRNPGVYAADLGSVIAGAKASLDRAGAIVRQTIGMASERVAAPQEARVAACLADIATLLATTWDHRSRIDIRADPDLPTVACDSLALQNAVLNLLFNARDAMPNGGVISVYAEAISLESGPGVEVSVADGGIGMTPDTVARAFEPFFTTKCDGLGGVGLPMVERFARDAGGRVAIDSEYGVGTTVRLRLPAASRAAEVSRVADTTLRQRPALPPFPSTTRLSQPETNP